jgi:5'-3' exonuclease
MGVKGLFQFLKQFKKDIYIPKYVMNKSVGIDIFWFLHLSKGDFLTLQKYLLPIINNSKEIICVFDGAPSIEKREHLKETAHARQELLESIDRIEKFLKYPFNHMSTENKYHINSYLNELKRQAWHPSRDFINKIKDWLIEHNCKIIQAPNEADEILVEMQLKGTIDTIITNDSDLIILGANNIIRLITPYKGYEYNKRNIQNIIGFTDIQWYDFMYLCKNMKINDVSLAYSLISVYKELDIVLEKYYINYKDSLINDTFLEKMIEEYIE